MVFTDFMSNMQIITYYLQKFICTVKNRIIPKLYSSIMNFGPHE